MPSFGDRLLVARMSKALVLANVRYWITVAPLVRARLNYWRRRAEGIPDPALRQVALVNLREEGFNAQATATLATLAPRPYRKPVIEAIVSLQIIYDYLDSLVERPLANPVQDSRHLYRAFLDAIAPDREPRGGYYPPRHECSDGGYLQELVYTVRGALARLPSHTVIAEVSAGAADRCAEAQTRAHAAASPDAAQLEQWARESAADTQLEWREFLAGAVSSGLALHALIALAADPRASREQALAVDALYLSLCALTTLLDGLVDHEQDLISSGRPGYLRYYRDRDTLTQGLRGAIDRAIRQTRELPDAPHHFVTLVGIVAYYASAPTADSEFARPVMQRVTRDLAPAMGPILALMRTWRAAKRLLSAIASTTGHR
jgi:tetraprenyl-beta-curcumene synthase